MERRAVALVIAIVALLAFALSMPEGAQSTLQVGGASAAGSAPREPLEFQRAGGVDSYWMTLSSGSFTAGPFPAAHSVNVVVPERTVALLVNLTPQHGANAGVTVVVEGGCEVSLGPLVGDGAPRGADCGAMLPGAREVQVRHEAGALTGAFSVAALVCVEGHSCAGPGAEYR